MGKHFVWGVALATFAGTIFATADARAHKLLARAYNVTAGGDLTMDPNDSHVEKTFQDSDTAGNYVNNSASVDSQTLILAYSVKANQSSGTKYTPSDWNVGAFLEQQMKRPSSGGATGVTVRLPLIITGASTPNAGATPTIVDVTGAIAVGNCRASAQVRITPENTAAPVLNDGCSGNPNGHASLLANTLVITMDSLLDEQKLEASLSFQTSFGGFGSYIVVDAQGTLQIDPIGGALQYDSPTFGKNPGNTSGGIASSSGGSSSGGTASSSGDSSGSSSGAGAATPPAAQPSSDDSSCAIATAGRGASPFALLGLAGAFVAALARASHRRGRRRSAGARRSAP